jgi:DNA-binding Lrp family transcriptional regulator
MSDTTAMTLAINAVLSATVTAAVVSGVVSVLVALIAYRQKARELDLNYRQKAQELELSLRTFQNRVAELQQRFEIARQEQVVEIVKKRAETYPAFYGVLAKYGRGWTLRGGIRDHAWASVFLDALLENNEKNGVFFSKPVYHAYGSLRDFLTTLRDSLRDGEVITDVQENEMYDIIMGQKRSDGSRAPGLGSLLKDDLAGYVTPALSALFQR